MKSTQMAQVDETPVLSSASKLPAIFGAVFDCLLAILLKFIDNTGTVQLRPSLGRMNRYG
jgi:hypothetical protein